jgi:hypothetical protein
MAVESVAPFARRELFVSSNAARSLRQRVGGEKHCTSVVVFGRTFFCCALNAYLCGATIDSMCGRRVSHQYQLFTRQGYEESASSMCSTIR